VYDYYRYCYEARERAATRKREAEAERMTRRRTRPHQARRRTTRLTEQLARLRAHA
jgi:hypothetical protein